MNGLRQGVWLDGVDLLQGEAVVGLEVEGVEREVDGEVEGDGVRIEGEGGMVEDEEGGNCYHMHMVMYKYELPLLINYASLCPHGYRRLGARIP